jgi:hypothetical protein
MHQPKVAPGRPAAAQLCSRPHLRSNDPTRRIISYAVQWRQLPSLRVAGVVRMSGLIIGMSYAGVRQQAYQVYSNTPSADPAGSSPLRKCIITQHDLDMALPGQIKLLKPETKYGILGTMKTPRVTEGPFQIKATASTPLYSLGNILS